MVVYNGAAMVPTHENSNNGNQKVTLEFGVFFYQKSPEIIIFIMEFVSVHVCKFTLPQVVNLHKKGAF